MKLGRKFRLTIENTAGGDATIIQNPFTIRFSIRRAVASSVNSLDIEIYNLAKNTRDNIFQDQFYLNPDNKFNRKIKLEAGYDSLSTIFSGTVMRANSTREGVDVITSISAYGGIYDITNNFIYQTVQNTNGGGITHKSILQTLIGNFNPSNLTVGAISNSFVDKLFQRPVVLEGNTYDLLKKYSDGKVFIDLDKVYILQDNEVLSGAIPLLDSSTGLLSTPRRDDSFLTLTTLFEPRIILGQAVDIYSGVQPLYNGQWKVNGIQHQGIISDAVCGDLKSVFSLFDPTKFSGSIVNVNPSNS